MSISRRDFLKTIGLGTVSLILPLSLPISETTCTTLDLFIPEKWAQASLDILKENMVMANLIYRDFSNQVVKFDDIINTRKGFNHGKS